MEGLDIVLAIHSRTEDKSGLVVVEDWHSSWLEVDLEFDKSVDCLHRGTQHKGEVILARRDCKSLSCRTLRHDCRMHGTGV